MFSPSQLLQITNGESGTPAIQSPLSRARSGRESTISAEEQWVIATFQNFKGAGDVVSSEGKSN
jgi:hypothetical protein